MTVADADLCGYCKRHGHPQDDCPVMRRDHRYELFLGCAVVCVLVPFAAAGMFLGYAWGAFRAGFLYSRDAWGATRDRVKDLLKKGRS